ncbi:F pilus assembly Type-IV secretion system for plasmid transfer [Vibrio thalassae]|uniref:F pilus assembly Type-IV secretion system for plasmid transfer n=1 Tax=Vibrio thalassae TaxID=1243014 RepID=A0A240EH25_9VIBR|nr:conjugative transfer ATPase [Vibrio thalassae]SNX47250.1 F pilus assembly Type-IV secretion system for plasmid transfer [Vibrio thalassae]
MTTLLRRVMNISKAFSTKSLYTQDDLDELYTLNIPSFSSKLPYSGYDAESETFILEDLISRAKVFTISPIATEGQSADVLASKRDAIEDIYRSFEERDINDGQWVIQEFTYEDNSVERIINLMRDSVEPHAQQTKFTESYLKLMERHYRTIAKDEGLYEDKEVTRRPWRFKTPRTKFIIYRRQGVSDVRKFNIGKHSPVDEINELAKDLIVKFGQADIKCEIDDDVALFGWLFRFFNPNPELNLFESRGEYYDRMCDVDGDLLTGGALCEALLSEQPRSDVDDNCWYFNNAPTRFLRFGGLRKQPRIGALTGEVKQGEGNGQTAFCAMDSLPSNSILSKTTVITPQPDFNKRFSKTKKSANGTNDESKRAAISLAQLDGLLKHDYKKVMVTMGVYVRGQTLDELNDNQRVAISTLNNNNIMVYKDAVDGLSLDSFINHLPMNFRPEKDKGMYLRSMWAQHAANLCFAFGRGEGTGNPCFSFFNRGGAPVLFDPISKKDKANNSFGFISGPAGSGKSVTITQMVYAMMAMKRPRMFVIEYGDSFAMAAEDWKKKGLNVNYLKVMPNSAPALAPFANIDKILDNIALDDSDLIHEFTQSLDDSQDSLSEEKENSDKKDSSREGDILGELEFILMLMITGSEDAELSRYKRADRALVCQALIETAKRQRRKGLDAGKGKAEPTVVSDIIETLENFSRDESRDLSDEKRNMLKDMALSLHTFTNGINHTLFNTPGDAWPDADVTIFNLGLLSQDANVSQLNVAFVSLMQHINNLAESTQFDERDIVSMTDEAHLLLNNNMLGKALTKVVKTARKLGHIPFFATQDLADLSGETKKILNNIEWFYCLNFGSEEARLVKDIKNLTDADVKLLESTRKLDRCYTEGVALTKRHRILFRVSPPSLMLAVAMTDSIEKAERRRLMKEMGITDELEAVYEMANRMDKARGIEGRLAYEDI